MKQNIRRVFKVFGLQVLFIILGFVFMPLTLSEQVWLRWITSFIMPILYIFFSFLDASLTGEKDAIYTEVEDRVQESGRKIDQKAGGMRYWAPRGFLVALLGSLVTIAVFLPICYFFAEWLKSVSEASTGANFVQVTMNLALLVYNGFFEFMRDAGILDWMYLPLSLLFVLAYGIGYTRGPKRRKKTLEAIAESRQRYEKKQRKERKERREKQKKG